MLPLVDKEPITGLITKGRRGKASKSRTLADHKHYKKSIIKEK
jgi:hypothetical protein